MFKNYYIFACILLHLAPLHESLLFPSSSLFQLTSSVSVPVEEYFPERRIIFDWCFQMNYDMPYRLSSFYNVPVWPVKNKLSRRSLQDLLEPGSNGTEIDWYEKYQQKSEPANRHRNDFTAGELYQGLEDLLVSYGFNETCLLKSVCDLARHPFADDEQNVLTEVLTFILTPSLHEGFDVSEQLYRETYEEAEQRGFMGADCSTLYTECKHNLMDSITQLMFLNG